MGIIQINHTNVNSFGKERLFARKSTIRYWMSSEILLLFD